MALSKSALKCTWPTVPSGTRLSIVVDGTARGAVSIGLTVILLVRTTRGRPSGSLVWAIVLEAKPKAQIATNQGNSLRAVKGNSFLLTLNLSCLTQTW